MSAVQRSKGIVLFRGDFGEADQYIHFLTEKWGVVSLLAKSSKKSMRRYVGGLDLFCHDEISVRGDPKERGYLTELTVLNSFTYLRNDLDKMLAAGRLLQWVRKLANIATPMPQVYRLLGQSLALIESEVTPAKLELLVLVFKVRLLAQVGIKPRVEQCVRCNGELSEPFYFDMNAGGLACASCLKTLPTETLGLSTEGRWMLSHGANLKLSQWSDFTFPQDRTRQVSAFLTQFASYHSHTHLPL